MISVKKHLKAPLNFLRREDGVVSIEALLILPAMFWIYLLVFSIFDTFRMYTANQKAAFTIGDAVSRDTAGIGHNYIDGMYDLLKYMTHTATDVGLRITVVKFDEDEDKFTLEWSEPRGTIPNELTQADIDDWNDVLPVATPGSYTVVVETTTKFKAPFDVGMGVLDIDNFIFTATRWGQIPWVD